MVSCRFCLSRWQRLSGEEIGSLDWRKIPIRHIFVMISQLTARQTLCVTIGIGHIETDCMRRIPMVQFV